MFCLKADKHVTKYVHEHLLCVVVTIASTIHIYIYIYMLFVLLFVISLCAVVSDLLHITHGVEHKAAP